MLYVIWEFQRWEEKKPDLTVQAQKQQHDEKEDGPQGWQRHHGYSFRVGDEGQARTWRENRKWGGEKGTRA